MNMSNAAATPTVVVQLVVPITVEETASWALPTAAFGATVGGNETTSRAGYEKVATRLASVEETMNSTTEESDEELPSRCIPL